MNEKIIAVAGLGFGDEGKGTIVDYLIRRYGIRNVVRYNGGAQAAHNVVSPEGMHHCFSQFGSGTLVAGVRTFLSNYMLVNPLSLLTENDVLGGKGITDTLSRLVIDRDCLMITPMAVIANRMQEISRGIKRHGSCGQGVGQTVSDAELFGTQALRIGDLSDKTRLEGKLRFLLNVKMDLAEQLVEQQPDNRLLAEQLSGLRSIDIDDLVSQYMAFSKLVAIRSESDWLETIAQEGAVFEGAQGVLLDKDHGFYPYITRTRTTFQNADELISRSGFRGQVVKLGVLRAYATRHGAGPFVCKDDNLRQLIPPCHNQQNQWQGEFRLGWFDLVATRYALEAAGPIDGLVITNLDRLNRIEQMKVCSSYYYRGAGLAKVLDQFELLPGSSCGIRRIKIQQSAKPKLNPWLADKLMLCQPVYSIVKDWRLGQLDDYSGSAYLEYLSAQLEAPIVMTSFGPTATEKNTLRAF